ncbi:MAG TPA: sigma-54 dependent transcriptional regulator [Roseateles sp.]
MNPPDARLLTLPDSPDGALSIRAKALVFCDPRSLALIEQVERVARSDASVIINGETGTGKELIARHIHGQSRRSGPFVAVNCGSLSDTLIDAELFGHEAGAYTGASHARAGWFEAAQGGTLFLDEIGDLPLPQQVKLLRVLQERQVTRLGSRRPLDIDVRLVAATHVDLQAAVEAGRFRRDLYYRLNIASVTLPPLAARPADILALADHFIAVYSRKLGAAPIRISPAAREALLAHAWPGNIRELENVIHFALIVNKGSELQTESLRLRAPVSAALPQPAPVLEPLVQLRQALARFIATEPPDLYAQIEEAALRVAFDHAFRNQVRTSALLGISRNVLRAQLKRFGLLGDRSGPLRVS